MAIAVATDLIPIHRPDSTFNQSPMAVALALVKNEGDIIAAWLSHICELFDLVYIADHQSTDGTREYLLDQAKSQNKIHLFSFEGTGYFQSEITNKLTQIAIEENSDVWLFPLDADEFLPIPSKLDFISHLNKFKSDQILLLNWQNHIPLYLQYDQEINFNTPFLRPSQPGLYDKVAVKSGTIRKMNWTFTQGNHAVATEAGTLAGLDAKVRFSSLIHIPIRSVDHFTLKCIQGNIATYQLANWRTRGPLHWHEMLTSSLRSGSINPDLIRGFAQSYGSMNNPMPVSVSVYDLIDAGWNVNTLNIAHENVVEGSFSRRKKFIQLATEILEATQEISDLQRFLQLSKDEQKSAMDASSWQKGSIPNSIKFNKLPDFDAKDLHPESSESELLQVFVSSSFTPREIPMPSTWESHVPFLYCLLNFFEPRRFVELGTHHGNCFFAACQIAKQPNRSIECIAIDTWAGDEHTGSYGNKIFDEFKYILRRDFPQGKYIRKFFNDAARQFEQGSIDLLHIDGLHTYEAVAEDFATWLPMLSNRGIIMFHDTYERARGFGVWKLWEEVSRKYPSLEFEHGHGLGVLLVGNNPDPHIKRLFEIVSKKENADFLRFFFSNIGGLSPMTIRK
ncbi:MAG TPA: class I SAM-dependent methyltransferase [Anaerolineales bacterium]|nr:class I SAM-dependent methyltransferase [Anaerolineales bacterium]